MIKNTDPAILGLDSCEAIYLAEISDIIDTMSQSNSDSCENFLRWLDTTRVVDGMRVPDLRKVDLDKIQDKKILNIINSKRHHNASWIFKASKAGGRFCNLENAIALLDLYNRGEIKFVLTPTAIGELNFNRHPLVKDFYDKYCTDLTIPDEYAGEFAQKVDRLARKYVENGTMSDTYSAAGRKRVPVNDAYIMGEWAVLGIIGLTANRSDFILDTYGDPRSQKVNDILKGIKEVNIQQGYSYTNVERSPYEVPPTAYTPDKFLYYFRLGKIKNLLGQVDPLREHKIVSDKVTGYAYSPVPYRKRSLK